jgi:IS30 family transposase
MVVAQGLPQPLRGIAYSDADIQAIEDKLNQWTRKRLGFRTP